MEKIKDVDAFVFGTPVYYASMAGNFVSFMDRVFYSASLAGHNDYFTFKPVASVITARRAGTTATYDQLNKYFGMNQNANYIHKILEHDTFWTGYRKNL